MTVCLESHDMYLSQFILLVQTVFVDIDLTVFLKIYNLKVLNPITKEGKA